MESDTQAASNETHYSKIKSVWTVKINTKTQHTQHYVEHRHDQTGKSLESSQHVSEPLCRDQSESSKFEGSQ